MAARKYASKVERARNRQLKSPGAQAGGSSRSTARADQHDYGLAVPKRLHEAIESERDNLARAGSILACMVVAMEYTNDPLTGPYFPDVAQIARELVERSINGLDPFVLKQRLRRNKIEEEFCIACVDPSYSFMCQAGSRDAAWPAAVQRLSG